MFPEGVYGRAMPIAADRVPERLPRGRHGLPRRFIVHNQRERMLLAVAEAVAEQGFVTTTVADIIARARLSRRTFYEHFADKEECFLAAYDTVVEQLLAAVGQAYEQADGWPQKVHDGLETFLSYLAAEPAFARMCIVEVVAAGPDARSRRDAAMRVFVDFLEPGRGGGAQGPRRAGAGRRRRGRRHLRDHLLAAAAQRRRRARRRCCRSCSTARSCPTSGTPWPREPSPRRASAPAPPRALRAGSAWDADDRPALPHPAGARRRRTRPRGQRRDGAAGARGRDRDGLRDAAHPRTTTTSEIATLPARVADAAGGAGAPWDRRARRRRRRGRADGGRRARATRSCAPSRSAGRAAGSCSSRRPARSTTRMELSVERLKARGLHAIVAHPERHADADLEMRLRTLARAGLPDPVDRRVRRRPGDAAADLALGWRHGLVHLLGSDAHSSRCGRPRARWRTASRGCARRCRPRRVEWMAREAPAAILRGRAGRAACVRLSARLRTRTARRGPRPPARSTTSREALPSPWRRKLPAPAAAPVTQRLSKLAPCAQRGRERAHHRVAAALARAALEARRDDQPPRAARSRARAPAARRA